MAKFKIKVIQHLLKGNKIAKSGDVVDGEEFVNLKDSLKGGYCEEVDPKDLEVDHEEITGGEPEGGEPEGGEPEGGEPEGGEPEGGEPEGGEPEQDLDPSDKTDLENMNYAELLAFADDNLIELDSKEKKSKASLREAIKSKM